MSLACARGKQFVGGVVWVGEPAIFCGSESGFTP